MATCHSAAVQNHGNQVALLYVGSAGNDLDGLTPHIYLANHQLVRIGMSLDLFDASHYYLVQICCHIRAKLNL